MSLNQYYKHSVRIIYKDDGTMISGYCNVFVPAPDNDGVDGIALDTGVWIDADEIKTIEAID